MYISYNTYVYISPVITTMALWKLMPKCMSGRKAIVVIKSQYLLINSDI